MKNRRVMCKNYKYDLLSYFQGKLMEGLENPSEDGITIVVQTFCKNMVMEL